MSRQRRTATLGGSLLTLCCALGLVAAPAPAAAYCRLTTGMPSPGGVGECDGGGVPLRWARQCLEYTLVPRTREGLPFDDPDALDIRDVVEASFAAWGGVLCGDGAPLPVVLRQNAELSVCDRPESNRDAPNANTVAFVSDWIDSGYPEDAFGVTLVWHDDAGEILDADMQLNENSGTFDFCTRECNGDGVDLQNVVTHEAGHFLGLGHSDEVNATMYAKSEGGEIRKRILKRDDIAGVCEIFADLPQPTCQDADFEPSNGFGPECYRRRDHGCSVGGAAARPGGVGAALPWAWALSCLGLWRRSRRSRRSRRG